MPERLLLVRHAMPAAVAEIASRDWQLSERVVRRCGGYRDEDPTRRGSGVPDSWPQVARFDAARAVARLAELHDVHLTVEGPCPGGEVGAAYVRWPDGRRSVLNSGSVRAGPLLDLARAAGLPVARYELVAEIDGTTVVVQQRLPGAPPTTVDADLVDQMAELNDRFAGLLAGHPEIPGVDLFLTADGPGFCLHEPLAAHNARTARLLDWVHEVGAGAPDVSGDDLMHLDFHAGNVLVVDGRITGLVDWDGAARGDRHFDLVVLKFGLAGNAPRLAARLDDRLARVTADRLRAYWAHISLRQVDWSIRHHDAEAVDRWLTVAEAGLD
jgi:hypothetical protein